MVFLFREVSTGKELCLGFNDTYFIGRRTHGKNHIVLDDKTVSKAHAVLTIKSGRATIEDLGSKRGTFVNKIRVLKPTALNDRDIILFGIQTCKYCFIDPKWQTVNNINIVNPSSNYVENILELLGVPYSHSYNDLCTHFTTETINFQSLKEKIILKMLIDRKTIVTPKYWIKLLERTKSAGELPDINSFMPKVDKFLALQGIKEVTSNLARRFILDDMLVICFDEKSKSDICDIVSSCGGEVILYSKSDDFTKRLKSPNINGYILIKNDTNIKSVIESHHLMKSIQQYNNNVCSISINDIYINILKATVDNFSFVRESLGNTNKEQFKEVVNENHSSTSSSDEIDTEEILPREQDLVRENSANVVVHQNIALSGQKRKSNEDSRLELHQNEKQRIIQTSPDKNSTNKNNSQRKMMRINPLAISGISQKEAGKNGADSSKTITKRPESDLEIWRKKYKDLEITEIF